MKEIFNNLGISYFSEGSGIPIVFIHGLSLDKTSTSKFFEPFPNKNFQRIYIDLPGMENSPAISPETSDDVLQKLIQFIKQLLGSRKFILYGHSYGAYLSIAIAKQLQTQVLGVFLTCPVITAEKSKRLIAKHRNIVEEPVNPYNNKEYWDDFMKMNVIINQQTWKKYQELIIPGLKKADYKFIDNLSQHYVLTNEKDLKNKTVQCKIKILVGTYDQIVGFKKQSDFVNHLDIMILKNAGHNLMIDQETIVKTQFESFLDNILNQLQKD